jgi:uncharacterized protein YjbI with pentapeptide repeats
LGLVIYPIEEDRFARQERLDNIRFVREVVTQPDPSDKPFDSLDLRGAPLARLNLSNARLDKADLTGANLRNAELTDASLEDVDLTDADLFNATSPT